MYQGRDMDNLFLSRGSGCQRAGSTFGWQCQKMCFGRTKLTVPSPYSPYCHYFTSYSWNQCCSIILSLICDPVSVIVAAAAVLLSQLSLPFRSICPLSSLTLAVWCRANLEPACIQPVGSCYNGHTARSSNFGETN